MFPSGFKNPNIGGLNINCGRPSTLSTILVLRYFFSQSEQDHNQSAL